MRIRNGNNIEPPGCGGYSQGNEVLIPHNKITNPNTKIWDLDSDSR